jgi:hypothetical protein
MSIILNVEPALRQIGQVEGSSFQPLHRIRGMHRALERQVHVQGFEHDLRLVHNRASLGCTPACPSMPGTALSAIVAPCVVASLVVAPLRFAATFLVVPAFLTSFLVDAIGCSFRTLRLVDSKVRRKRSPATRPVVCPHKS